MAGWSTNYDIHFYGEEQELKAIDEAFAKKTRELKESGKFDYAFWEFLEVYDPRSHTIQDFQCSLDDAINMKIFFREIKAAYPSVIIKGSVSNAFLGGDYEEIEIRISSEEGSPELVWEETYRDEDSFSEYDDDGKE